MSQLVGIHILGLPLDLYQRVSEHSDELLREFALIRGQSSEHVPARLLALVEELRGRFGAFSEGPTTALQEAAARGDTEIDLYYEMPQEAGPAVLQLGQLLDEADDFCRSGDLLTLATQPEGLGFRRWFLEEFERQIAGHPPRPWSAVMKGGPPG